MANYYIPLPSNIAQYSNSTLIGHYSKLRSLAWSTNFQETGPILTHQLCDFIGLSKSQLYKVINDMVELGWISKTNYPGGINVKFEAQSDLSENSYKSNIVKLFNLKNNYISNTNLTMSDKSDSVLKIGLILRKLGIHQSLADSFITTIDPQVIYQSIEWFKWAKSNGTANGAGWLVRCLQENWQEPTGFVYPGWQCEQCKGQLDKHNPGCRIAYNLWGAGAIDLETICKTCGRDLPNHAGDCWRAVHSNQEPGAKNDAVLLQTFYKDITK